MSASESEDTSLKCSKCDDNFTDGVHCSACNKYQHFHCAGITEKGYRQLGSRKNVWRCFICKQPPIPSPSPVPDSNYEVLLKEIKSIGAKLMPLDSLVLEVQNLRADLSELKTTTKATENTIKEFSLRFTKIESRLKLLENAKTEQASMKSQIEKIVNDLNEKEQWDRMNNVELKGIPQNKNENLLDLVCSLGKKIQYPISKTQLNFATRVQTRDPDHIKPVIVCFNNRYIKEDFIAAARAAIKISPILPSELGLQGRSNIYVNDHLTIQNKTLLTNAKKLGKEQGFQYTWVKNARIFLRKNDSSPIITIRTPKDLSKISSQ